MSDDHAHAEITQLVYRYARAIDRLDEALLRTCYHPDAIDERPPLFVGGLDEFVGWVMPVLRKMTASRHLIGNVLIELAEDGASAGVESYFVATLRQKDGDDIVETVRHGRYLDMVSRRGGDWRIAHRRAIIDFSARSLLTPDQTSTALMDFARADDDGKASRRDQGDLSYLVLRGVAGEAGA